MSERVLYPDEEQRRRAHLFQFDPPQFEGGQQKQQAVDAGRDGQRQHGVQDLTQKTKREDPRKLKQIFRNKIPLWRPETPPSGTWPAARAAAVLR